MPKIFEYFGFVFFFYSNEHEPIHVHVKHSSKEAIFDLIIEDGVLVEIVRREAKDALPLPKKDEKVAREFIKTYYKEIIDKWVRFFVLREEVKTTEIKVKL